jgi:drug/metabolite transporter (DMT)-like permease
MMWIHWLESAEAIRQQFVRTRAFGERYRGGILFATVTLIMGMGYVAIGIGTETIPPTVLAAFRFDVSAVVLLTYAVLSGHWRPRTTVDVFAIITLGELVFAGTIGFLFVGQQYTTPSIAAVVMGLGPIVTIPIAYLLVPSERLSRADIVGVLLGFFGVAIVANPSPAQAAMGANVGIAFVCCAVLSSSLGGVLLSRFETELSPVVLTGWGALLGGMTLHLVSIGLGESARTISWTPASLVALVYLAVIVGVGGYTALLVLLTEIGPTRSSLTSFASPIVAIGAGWFLVGEAVTVTTLVGLVVVVGGFALPNWSSLSQTVHRFRRRPIQLVEE